ncbi:protein broad-minded isoform X2 [Vidua chalybeata]|uniref:protein broad-minded isoform X2 n=1 Tax=Vidua chalybeata TaxID=81927 RepID=UPI0023A891A4|nr:protein broad-minded isoform X2 [Vidua chalybeata]
MFPGPGETRRRRRRGCQGPRPPKMSHFTSEDEALLQSMLRQLLQSVKEKITGAPSVECAEEILLHLEETDENFHNYEFVKYLRQYIKNTVGPVIEEETEKCTSAQSQGEISGYDTLVQHLTKKARESKEYREMIHALKNVMMVVVESLINKFEEDRMHDKELANKAKKEHQSGYYTDNCSDSDSSFNQSYAFMSQEQLQLLTEKLDPSQPKEVRQEALQTLCLAPASDILSSESWPSLSKHLTISLADPDATFSEKILRFYAKTFSSSPFNMTREVYTSLAGLDVSNADVNRLLKKVRLLNEYQKEAPSSWIRHPEKYMEEVVESTLSLLSLKRKPNHPASPDFLSPMHFLALLDIKAVWFKKWTHAYYSRKVVFRLLEKKYKSLINAAVQQCLDYFEFCKAAVNKNSKVGDFSQQHCSDMQNFSYTGPELQYICFVHSVCLLGRLLIYKEGQNLFPVQLKNKKATVSITDVLVLFVQLIYHSPSYPKTALAAHTENYSPESLVMEILQVFCDQTGCAAECLYTDTVIDALLHPVQSLLNGTEVYINCLETTLLDVADILARIAASEDGLSLLLYGENEKNAKDSPTAAHVLVQFTKKLLHDDISLLSGSEFMPVVKGAFIFVCRQMYRTCEGLQMLIPYGLHESIAEAWRKTSLLSERVPTPVTDADSTSSISQESKSSLLWEETLLDALLNFSTTPKGLFLLHSTDAMNDCVNFMFNSLSKKIQTNEYEDFGNRIIITQMATTPMAAVALQNSGFIKTLVTELWALLECGKDDLRITQPKSTPVDPIDQSCQKSFLFLVNLLTYPAVFELLNKRDIPNKPMYSFREVPTDIIDIIDRLIILNSEAKIHSLFNYEQSHIFGLRLLNVLCCELNTLLLLETQYKVSQVLLTAQEENVTETSEGPGVFIIDGLSVERNHVLVRINLIGGPQERTLPLRELDKGSGLYPWPMFSSFPVPKCYLAEIPRKAEFRQDKDLDKLLKLLKSPEKPAGWAEICRKHFCKVMKTRPDSISGPILAELIEKFVSHLSESRTDCYFSMGSYKAMDADVKKENLSSVQQLGVEMTVRYGKYLNLLKEDAENGLCFVLMNCEEFLKQQQRTVMSSLCCLQEHYAGYDWFASSIFLIMSGDREKTLTFLQQFSCLLVSAFLWLPRLHLSMHLPVTTVEYGIHPVYFCSAHHVEMLLKAELPLVCSAFHMSGFTPSQTPTARHPEAHRSPRSSGFSEKKKKYKDYFEFLFRCQSALFQACVDVLRRILLSRDSQLIHQRCSLCPQRLAPESFLQHMLPAVEEALHGFRVSDYLDYMESLEEIYRPMLLKDMRTIKAQNT